MAARGSESGACGIASVLILNWGFLYIDKNIRFLFYQIKIFTLTLLAFNVKNHNTFMEHLNQF